MILDACRIAQLIAKGQIRDPSLFLNEYPAACCGWDGQETDLRKTAYLHLDD